MSISFTYKGNLLQKRFLKLIDPFFRRSDTSRTCCSTAKYPLQLFGHVQEAKFRGFAFKNNSAGLTFTIGCLSPCGQGKPNVCRVTNELNSVKEAEEEGKKKKTCSADRKIPHEDLVPLTTST